MLDQKKIGVFLATERKRQGLTQEQLAETLGVSNRSVSRWENGQNMPDYAQLEPLCAKLDISINELFAGERIEPKAVSPQYDANIAAMAEAYQRMRRRQRITWIVCGVVLAHLLPTLVALGLFLVSGLTAKVETVTDPAQYGTVIGKHAREEYRIKWGMDETIFPASPNISDVQDFEMVYYNPWDAQYLCWLVVEYDDEAYAVEKTRLSDCPQTSYIGYYGVTGFSEYQLLAMYADPYYGFVYALTDGEGTIIYVELIFCNYFYDLRYWKYIPSEYLPDGFDAVSGNPYELANRAASPE